MTLGRLGSRQLGVREMCVCVSCLRPMGINCMSYMAERALENMVRLQPVGAWLLVL